MINLLPQNEKNALLHEENWKLAFILETLLLVFLILLSLILFSVRIYVLGKLEEQKIVKIAEEKKAKTFEKQDFRKKINTASRNFSKLDLFYQGQVDLTETLEKVSRTLPPGIYLTGFSYQKETSQIGLSGFSGLRETLFEFKKNLENEKDFQDIYFPPSSWVKSREVDFNATFKIK
jgi:Tfp pilus assembly protein PilN